MSVLSRDWQEKRQLTITVQMLNQSTIVVNITDQRLVEIIVGLVNSS